MKATTLYLSLGSNLGDRAGHLRKAVQGLIQENIFVVQFSALYESSPQDVAAQPWFLNQVVECEAAWPPLELLRRLQRIEREGGRSRRGAVRRGPRPIDIDILLFGDRVIHTRHLEVPHPRLTGRRFALLPLLELAPGLIHPETRAPLSRYLDAVGNQELRPFHP